ncbi:ABC transporter permease [Undibacterium danionis]|uniref:ABC transporter permease n=1 Tax=Undibacterium danionis TaxID=1812100 RepID=A0ABV6IHV1_9BURK
MFNHLWKILWKRKLKNAMISAEILLIFVVIFGVVVGFTYNYRLYNRPLGFDIDHRWRVSLEANSKILDTPQPQLVDQFRRAIAALPEVTSVSFIEIEPYSNSGFGGDFRRIDQDQKIETYSLSADDMAAKTLAISQIAGRWFSAQDEASGEIPIVINRKLAQNLFKQEDPLGKMIANTDLADKENATYRVVGVIENYRYFGEFMSQENIAIFRHSAFKSAPLSNIVIQLQPGTPRNFEIKLYQQLRLVRNDIEYTITPLIEERDQMLRQKAMFFVPPVLIAVFLLIMVCFGLFGVLWQNVNSRIPELGLRRAIGASSAQIYGQIVTEQLLLSSFAMAVGMLFLIQLPFTGIFAKFMDWNSFFLSTGLAMAIIYLVSIVCALYPAWMASRMNPTDALHYE